MVEFVKERLASSNLVRPQATSPSSRSKNLSPLEEDNESSDSSASSVGARGVALSLGGSAMSESQVEDDDASDASSIDDEALMEEARNPFQDPGYNAENEDDGDDEDWAEEDDDDEISDLLETLVNRSGESSEHDDSPLAGVAADRDDILITIPKAKRVLSFNTLVALNSEIERIRNDSLSPKRAKHQSGCDVGESHNGLFSGFSLGPSALDEPFPSPMKFRPRESPVISSSDDEELDRQLQDELGDGHRRSRDNSPVPLLTPPESPLTIEIDGDRATFCEWPSNLAVDTAFAAAINDKRSLSPASLDGSSDDEKTDVAASTLTPLLRGISVGR